MVNRTSNLSAAVDNYPQGIPGPQHTNLRLYKPPKKRELCSQTRPRLLNRTCHSQHQYTMHVLALLLSCCALTAVATPLANSFQPTQVKRFATTTTLPASSGHSVLSTPKVIAAGASFDGGMYRFDRGVSCTGQTEGGDSDAVFQVQAGGTLRNVIIGTNQIGESIMWKKASNIH